jgi:hypothetical protein
LRLYLALGILLASTVVKGEENPEIKELEHELISANEDTPKVKFFFSVSSINLLDSGNIVRHYVITVPGRIQRTFLIMIFVCRMRYKNRERYIADYYVDVVQTQ